MSQLSEVTQRLRESLLAGDFGPGEKLGEVTVAERLGVSRTPARLAMAALEQEGLLVREPHRGVTVRAYTLDEVTDAILVRGQLEGMAARLVAERGLDERSVQLLEDTLAEAETLLAKADFRIADRTRWIELNQIFHACLIEAAGNQPLADAIHQVSLIPLAAANAIVFNQLDRGLGHGQLASAHDDHRRVLQAIRDRQGMRAESIMREHAQRSADNKRHNFSDLKKQSAASLPGVALVR
jgi:GntR family transcriptional regulator of vanillate catabolism